jgi:hypothetical protein
MSVNTTTEHIFVEALSLPTRSRAELAQKLLASLESEMASPEIETAWKTEALDRCKAYDEGRITERDAENLEVK